MQHLVWPRGAPTGNDSTSITINPPWWPTSSAKILTSDNAPDLHLPVIPIFTLFQWSLLTPAGGLYRPSWYPIFLFDPEIPTCYHITLCSSGCSGEDDKICELSKGQTNYYGPKRLQREREKRTYGLCNHFTFLPLSFCANPCFSLTAAAQWLSLWKFQFYLYFYEYIWMGLPLWFLCILCLQYVIWFFSCILLSILCVKIHNSKMCNHFRSSDIYPLGSQHEINCWWKSFRHTASRKKMSKSIFFFCRFFFLHVVKFIKWIMEQVL